MNIYKFSKLQFFLFLFFKIFCGFKITDGSNIPKKGGFILASNHISYLDPMLLGVASSRDLNFMARHDLFSNFLYSQALLSARAFPVKRNSADISALREGIKRLKKGAGLVVFPEGSRRVEGKPAQAQSGIAFLALKANVPIVPAFIKGADLALPKGRKLIRPTKISVVFGKQFYMDQNQSYQDNAQGVLNNIEQLSH